jgi:3-hydroxyacyl-CoA dehydrogenase
VSKNDKHFKVAAATGHKVTMVELDAKLLDKAQKSIEKSLERMGKKQFKGEEGKISAYVQEAMSRINSSTDLNAVVKDTDLVIEAIVENLAVKQKLFGSIDGVIGCYPFLRIIINSHIF